MSEVEIFRIIWVIFMVSNVFILHKSKALAFDIGTAFAIVWGPIFTIAIGYMWLFKKFNILQPMPNGPQHKVYGRNNLSATIATLLSSLTVIIIMLLYLPMPK